MSTFHEMSNLLRSKVTGSGDQAPPERDLAEKGVPRVLHVSVDDGDVLERSAAARGPQLGLRNSKTKTKKTIGSDGKLVNQPNDSQAKFTKYGTPVGTPDYVGFDTRTQCSPEEIAHIKKHGYYSIQWRQLRGQK